MNRDVIKDRVFALLAAHFSVGVDGLNGRTHLVHDLYADSMEMMDLVMVLNDCFEINILPDDLLDMKTLQDVVDVVNRLTSNPTL